MSNLIYGQSDSIAFDRKGSLQRVALEVLPRIGTQSIAQQLLFIGLTVFVVLTWGYQFGTNDQNVHLPFLKKFADAALYPGDPFTELRWQHFSYFWLLFVPFYRLGILAPAMFFAHIAATYLTFWTLWTLSESLFHNRLASFLSVLWFALPHVTFGGWTFFEVSLLNRTAVLPLLFGALALYIKRLFVFAFALLGLAYDLHALSANFVLAMFCFDSVWQWRKIGFRKMVAAMSTFFVVALPVIGWKFGHSSADFQINWEWLRIVSFGLFGTTYLFGSFPFLEVFTASGIGTFLLLAIALKYAPPTNHTATVTHFGIAILLLVLVQCIAVQWFPVNILIQSQLLRADLFALLFGMLYFVYSIAMVLQAETHDLKSPVALLAALTLPFAFAPVLAWGMDRFIRAKRNRLLAITGLCLGTCVLSQTIVAHVPAWRWSIHVSGESSAWRETQEWARDNTRRDALFITPPHIGSIRESDWRVFSERSTIVSIAEIVEVALVPDYTETFRERFSMLAPGALEKMNGNPFRNRELTRDAFYSLSDDAILRAACRYSASYLVSEKPYTRAFEEVYENDEFVVYVLPIETCAKPIALADHFTEQ